MSDEKKPRRRSPAKPAVQSNENPAKKPDPLRCPFDGCDRFVSVDDPWGCDCMTAKLCRSHFDQVAQERVKVAVAGRSDKLAALEHRPDELNALEEAAYKSGIAYGKETATRYVGALAAAMISAGAIIGVVLTLAIQWALG